MTSDRFHAITGQYESLRIAVVGDFCLDRYLDIDPARAESSIETGLEVHNVVRVRPQPGGAGTVLNNLAALGAGEILAAGFCGDDGEGYELTRALAGLPGVDLTHFIRTPLRRTFTYCKPLVVAGDSPPRELNRLDSKNWTATPPELSERLAASLAAVSERSDAVIAMEQVDVPETGVLTRTVLDQLRRVGSGPVPVIADSRQGLRGYPPCIFKMNAAELAALSDARADDLPLETTRRLAIDLAASNRKPVFVTLAESGVLGAEPSGTAEHVPALPLRGPIDIVGAGDAVTANLACALAAGATPREAMELAALAASVVIHQLGTTGTASVSQMEALL